MHGTGRRHRSPLALIALVVVVTGCSALSLVWNYVDGVLVDRVDAWTGLSDEQRADLEQRLQPWLDHVAVERLPDYTDYLRAAAQRTRTDLEATDVDWASRHARTHYRELVADAIDSWLASTLADIESDQLDHLRTKMRQENAAYRARYLDVTRRESQRALASRIIDFAEGWIGPLSVQQSELLYSGVQELPDTSLEWYRYRTRMQAGLLARLRGDADEAAVAAWLRGWWVERAALRPSDRAAFQRFQHELVDLLAEFAGTLTPMQRLALGRRLRGIADELETIHFQTIRG